MGDPGLSRRLLEFEIGLDRRTCDRVVEQDWGAAFLSPSLPLIWDANWLAIERTGLSAEELVALGDEALGGAGFSHRTLALCDEADGARLAPEFEALPGWEVERNRHMVWRPQQGGQPSAPTAEMTMEAIQPLRRELIRESMPAGADLLEQTVDQLLELEDRFGVAGGDRWFVAPPEDPTSACRLLSGGGIAQVEDVGTLEAARGRGLAQSVVRAALDAAQALAPELTFLCADADDWPQLFYAKLGFEAVGDVHILRRKP
ncbi:MAG TPA: GNAT family N-acetyltransferase [Solirubrobacterales bacterium]|jgi:GNAT superfamily N-acetyltransferase|nr:GNAT family N-acetyltransferase [Solirubrobacterales bacterium]